MNLVGVYFFSFLMGDLLTKKQPPPFPVRLHITKKSPGRGFFLLY